MEQIFIGIDVSQGRLDAHVRRSDESFAVARDDALSHKGREYEYPLWSLRRGAHANSMITASTARLSPALA
jgi:hypothetical protein